MSYTQSQFLLTRSGRRQRTPTGVTSAPIDLWSYTDSSATTTSPLTFSLSSGGTNRLGVVYIVGDFATGADDITGVTWGGLSCTLAAKLVAGFPDSNGRCMYVYYRLGQATGSQTISVASATNHVLQGIAAAYTGVLQSGTPADALDTTPVTNHSATATENILNTFITTTTAGSWVILVDHSSPTTPGDPLTSIGVVKRISTTAMTMSLFDSNGPVTPSVSYQVETHHSANPASRGINHIVVAFKRS